MKKIITMGCESLLLQFTVVYPPKTDCLIINYRVINQCFSLRRTNEITRYLGIYDGTFEVVSNIMPSFFVYRDVLSLNIRGRNREWDYLMSRRTFDEDEWNRLFSILKENVPKLFKELNMSYSILEV